MQLNNTQKPTEELFFEKYDLDKFEIIRSYDCEDFDIEDIEDGVDSLDNFHGSDMDIKSEVELATEMKEIILDLCHDRLEYIDQNKNRRAFRNEREQLFDEYKRINRLINRLNEMYHI